ncbi:hypothetical protein C8J56DRAFT_1131874, partial [Mycena floridula]
MAEAMGPTNASQIIDLQPNNNNDFMPAYAIYENGVPMRVALFNYMDDPTGASTLSVTGSVAGGNLPQVMSPIYGLVHWDWSCVPQAATKAKWGDFATGVINVTSWLLRGTSFPLLLVIFSTLASDHPLFCLHEIRPFRCISWSKYALWKVLNEHGCRQKAWPRAAQAAMIAKWLKFATGVVNLLRMASFPLILVIFPTLGSDRPLLCQHEMRLFQRSAGSEYLPWMVLMNRAIAEGLSGPW